MRIPLRPVVAAAALAALLVPGAPPAPAAAAGPTSIIWDPGPSHRCFAVTEEHYGEDPGEVANPYQDTSGCDPLDDPTRVDGTCTAFGHTGPYGPACPAWKFLTVGWYYQRTADPDSGDFRRTPGYDFQADDGSPLTVRLRNSASGMPDPCALRETAFAYEYPSSSFRRKADWSAWALSDGSALDVSYMADLARTGEFTCPTEHRAILTTDLIYVTNGRKDVISVVHYDPGSFSVPDDQGVYWRTCDDGGCRVMVRGEQITPGTPSRITVDFAGLARRFGADLGHPDGIPADSTITAVQIVSSNRGSDTEVSVSDTSVNLS